MFTQFTQLQSEMVEQGRRALELSRTLAEAQLEHTRKAQAHAQAAAETAGKMALDAAKIGLDGALAAHKAILDTLAPPAAQ